MTRWHQRARELQADAYALYLAARDGRTPWYARLLAFLVAAYAFSPIDLIPDPIPVLGYLDDLLLVPLGVLLVLQLIPPEVMAENRQRARAAMTGAESSTRWGALIVIALWVVTALAVAWAIRAALGGQ